MTTTTKSGTRDRFEHLVVGALLTLADLARSGPHDESRVELAKGHAFALVDAWAHARAAELLAELVIGPLTRKLRALDENVSRAAAGEGEGWHPYPLPVEAEARHAWLWQCDGCGDSFRCEIEARELPGGSVAASVEQLVKIAGWETRGGQSPRARCPKCVVRARIAVPHG